MSDKQSIRVSLAVGIVMGAAIAFTGQVVLTGLVAGSAIGLAVWSLWSNEQ